MKTKELIQWLQTEDPTGELEVCVNNVPIYTVENQPAYYDGPLQMLIHDESKRPYYSIVGYKVTQRGNKIKLTTMDIGDCLIDNPDMPVDLSELANWTRKRWEECVETKRKEYRQMDIETAMELACLKPETCLICSKSDCDNPNGKH
jgi:hypothetical protein